MNINQHIRIYLFQNGSLILSKLGIFDTVYQSAKPDPRKKQFHPPVKSITFKEDRTLNDNAFANYLAKAGGIGLTEAAKELNDFITDLWDALKKGKRVSIPGIGILSLGKDQKLHFSPDQKQNFIPEAAASETLSIKPVKRSKSEAKAGPSYHSGQDQKRKASGTSVLWPVLFIMVLFIILYFIINPLNYSFVQKHYSGMLPLVEISKLNLDDKEVQAPPATDENEKTATQPRQEQEIEKQENQATTEKATTKEENKQEEDKPAMVKEQSREKPAEVKLPAEPMPQGPQHYIIVASYNIPQDAEEFKDKLIKQGYDAHVIGPSKNGMYRVSIGHFSDKNKAESFLGNIKRTHTPNAWMLKK